MFIANEEQSYCPVCERPVDKVAVTCPNCKSFLIKKKNPVLNLNGF